MEGEQDKVDLVVKFEVVEKLVMETVAELRQAASDLEATLAEYRAQEMEAERMEAERLRAEEAEMARREASAPF